MRALAVGLVVVAIGASTAVVSAGTVADDALYSVKITSEQMRLALATSPEDRAVVELSIAEHRLAEATALATLGDEDNAIVATSEYGEHVANAAAELAQMESFQPQTKTLVMQLQQRIDEHRATAVAVLARLADDPSRAAASAALSVIAARGSPAPDLSPAAAIAQDAADTADEAAAVAERKATSTSESSAPQSSGTTDPAPATVVGDTSATAGVTRGENAQGERVSKKERAAGAARKAADEAKAAAKKAKQGSRRSPEPNNPDDSKNRDDSSNRDD